jgi:hypothetical protein
VSSLTIPASTPREAAFRARRNRDTAKAAQLHVRTARFPVSFLATDALRSEVRTKSAYYSVIAGAVSRLPNNTRDARLALYDRAEIALTAELLQDPRITDEEAAVERLALERAVCKIESDARRKEKPNRLREEQRRPFSFLSFFRVFNRQI